MADSSSRQNQLILSKKRNNKNYLEAIFNSFVAINWATWERKFNAILIVLLCMSLSLTHPYVSFFSIIWLHLKISSFFFWLNNNSDVKEGRQKLSHAHFYWTCYVSVLRSLPFLRLILNHSVLLFSLMLSRKKV